MCIAWLERIELAKSKLATGKFTLVFREVWKSEVWKTFAMVVNSDGHQTGYVQCTKCKVLMKYDSKKTGSSSLSRHALNCAPSTTTQMKPQQSSLTKFVARNVPLTTKQAVTENCMHMCAKDIRPFYFVQGKGFLELAQELITVGATHGRVPANSVLQSPNTVAKRCQDLAEEKREVMAKQVKDILKNGGKVGMSTDMWTDDFRKIHYLSITCHYVRFRLNWEESDHSKVSRGGEDDGWKHQERTC